MPQTLMVVVYFCMCHSRVFSRSVAVREAYQSKIGQRIHNSNLHVHLNPNFRESGRHTYRGVAAF